MKLLIKIYFSVPPDILDYPTSSDQVAREGANVTLRCAAHGVPTPTVVWRKEAGDLLPTSNFSDTHSKTYSLFPSSTRYTGLSNKWQKKAHM